jgi:hypothetical protein
MRFQAITFQIYAILPLDVVCMETPLYLRQCTSLVIAWRNEHQDVTKQEEIEDYTVFHSFLPCSSVAPTVYLS